MKIGTVHLVAPIHTLLVNDEKLKDPTKVANIYIYIYDSLLAEISKISIHCKFNSISYD